MDGNNVFSFSITDVVKTIKEFMEQNSIPGETVDLLALHQSNILIMKTIAKKCKVDLEKLPIVIDKCGNTVSSSIPLAIASSLNACEERRNGYHIVASGYGLGLSWGVIDMVVGGNAAIGVNYTDFYFDDGHYEKGGNA